MSPPKRSSVPIPSTRERAESKKKGHVMQSSLELVFSYSRSQQLHYGSLSAPSFMDDSSLREDNFDDQYLGDYDEEGRVGEDGYDARDAAGQWDELAAGTGRWSHPISEEGEDRETAGNAGDAEGEDGHDRRPSEGNPFFESDPFPAQPRPLPQEGAAYHTPPQQSKGQGLISIQMMSPHSAPNALSTSYSTNTSSSGGTQMPGKAKPWGFLRKDTATSSQTAQSGGTSAHATLTGEESQPLLGSKSQQGYDATTPEGLADRSRRRKRPQSGQSTEGQTLFNATAVLVGIGLLSLPLAFSYAGWVLGTIMLVGFGWLTCYTAKLLARLIRADSRMAGYTDIGRRAFGPWAGAAINFLFCLELFALGVALVVLFGDTLNVLYPSVSPQTWKLIGFFIIVPTALMPLRLLSLPSLLSFMSSLLLIIVLLIDGFRTPASPTSPGSIRHPQATDLWPEWQGANWLGGIGLILAGFGGHAVMPSLARDMKRPERFERVVDKAFAIATGISLVAGAAGYLMIGPCVSDEITKDLMQEKYQYPRILNTVALWMIVINPLTKFGLSSRPLNITLESILGIGPTLIPNHLESSIESHSNDNDNDQEDSVTKDPHHHTLSVSSDTRSRRPTHFSSMSSSQFVRSSPMHPDEIHTSAISDSSAPQSQIELYEKKERRNFWLRNISRAVVTALCVVTAVVLPGFGRVMAFLGSFSAFLICIILPLLFYIKLSPTLVDSRRKDRGSVESITRMWQWTLVVGSVVLMIAGTVWAFLPGSGHGEVDP